MGRLAVLALVTAMLACIARDRLVCDDDTQCTRAEEGVCLAGACAYPDGDCPSGLRYSSLAGEKAGRCVDNGEVADDSTTEPGTTDDSSATTGSDTTAGGSTTSDDDTGPIPTSCDDVTCSDAGTCVMIDDAPTCACASGYFMVGLECVLDPCTEVTCRYVDDVGGDDENDGSMAAPWRTLDRLSQAFADAAPGDHFLLRRGGVWGDADGGYRLSISGANGTFEAPIVIGAYGPLADGRPRLAPAIVRINAATHVVLRDLDIEDDPDSVELFELYGNRPCILVQDSDHVVVSDNVVSSCNSRGIWVAYGSSYSVIIDNVVQDTGNNGIAITDITWDDPIVRVGPHHWILDNTVERAGSDGIIVDIGSVEVELGDAKIARNFVADATGRGVTMSTTGYAWVVDNIVARATGIGSWQGGLTISAQIGGQLSGNIAFENAGNGLAVQHVARVVGNTVIHDGTVGEAIVVDDYGALSAARNLVWARGGRDSLRVLAGAATDHVVALDENWYVGEGELACVFRDGLDEYDLPQWRAATGFDLASTCGPVPGLAMFETDVPASAWDDEFLAAFAPPASWSGCADPVGARGCDGAPIGPPIEPIDPLAELDGVGWDGPLLVRQRYDVFPE